MKPIENTISFLIANTHDKKIKQLNENLEKIKIPSGKNVKHLARWLGKIYDIDIVNRSQLGRLPQNDLHVLYLILLINYTILDIENLIKEDNNFTLSKYASNVSTQLHKTRATIIHHIQIALFTYEHNSSFRKKFDFFITLIRDNHE